MGGIFSPRPENKCVNILFTLKNVYLCATAKKTRADYKMKIKTNLKEIDALFKSVLEKELEIKSLKEDNARLVNENVVLATSIARLAECPLSPVTPSPQQVIPLAVDGLKKALGGISNQETRSMVGMVLMNSLEQPAQLEHYQTISYALDLSQRKGQLATHVKVEVAGNLLTRQLNEIHDNGYVKIGENGY